MSILGLLNLDLLRIMQKEIGIYGEMVKKMMNQITGRVYLVDQLGKKMKKQTILLALCLLVASVSLSAQTKVIAHRGYWNTDGSAQNSLTALRRAAEIGCWGSEFDVWLTSDGELVVFHDRKLGGEYDRPITEMTAEEVRAHRLPNGERVPTLAEYLAEALKHPNLHLVFELKPHPTPSQEREAVAKGVQMVEEMGLADRTDYISFSLEAGH